MEPNSTDRWHAMLTMLRAIARFLDEKIGWNRIGVLLSVAIIGIPANGTFQMLRDIDVSEVVQAVRDTDKQDIAFAALFVALGYFTLTFYDLFALRAIGRTDVPYRIPALAAFTRYSLGPNVARV